MMNNSEQQMAELVKLMRILVVVEYMKLGLTQGEIAKKIGVAKSAVNEILKNISYGKE